jgi:hypothetical protein
MFPLSVKGSISGKPSKALILINLKGLILAIQTGIKMQVADTLYYHCSLGYTIVSENLAKLVAFKEKKNIFFIFKTR